MSAYDISGEEDWQQWLQTLAGNIDTTPRRAPSNYNLFMQQAVPVVRAANPGISNQAAFRMAASIWSQR